MNFVETQFPSDISYGATGGPIYSTDVVTLFSGHEQRNSNWKKPKARYDIASGVKTEEQWQALIAFFRARKGKAIGFRFKNWSDFNAVNQQVGIGDDLTTEFQLVKSYTSGSAVVARIINKPVIGTVKIHNSNNLRGNADYSVDYTTGIVSFTEPPASGVIITADFEFDVPVRFNTDELQISLDSFNTGSWNSIPLIEIRI